MDTIAARVGQMDDDRLAASSPPPATFDDSASTVAGSRMQVARAISPPLFSPVLAQPAAAGHRLRWHLLGFAAALLLPVLAFAVGVAVEYGAAQRARLEGEARAVARDLEAAVDRELSALLAAAQTLATSSALETRDFPAFERQAYEVAAARDVEVFLVAPSGRHVVSTAVPRGSRTVASPNFDPEPAARAAMAAGLPFVSNLFKGPLTDRNLLRVSVPAHVYTGDGAGWDHGRLVLVFTPDRLRTLLTGAGLPPGWLASIVDRGGITVARSHLHDRFVGVPATRGLQDNTQGSGGVFRAPTLDGVMALGAFARTTFGDWRVTVGVPVPLLEAPLWRLFWWLAGVGASLTGFAVSLALALAHRVEASVGALAATAAELGSGRCVPLPATPVREVNAVSAALAAAGAELRARTEAERAARQEARRELLQAVIDGTSDPILARDLDGRFVLVNSAGAALLGVSSPAAALNRRASDLLPAAQADAVVAWDRAVLADGQTRVVEVCFGGGAAGPERVFVTTKSLWRDADGRIAGVVCVARDETARRAAEERLESVRAELLRASRLGAVGAMAAGLAHELNQPLGAAANFLAAAETMLGPTAGEGAGAGARPAGQLLPAPDFDGAREAVAEATRQALRAGEIVRRLRNFVAQGDTDMRAEEVGPLVAEACAAVLPSFSTSGGAAVALRVHTAADAGAALVDRVQIQQVVINLVRNAAEALGGGDAAGGGEIAVSVRRSAGGGCEVSVADTGPGIAPEVRDRLFEPFAGTKPRGMGIGLAICRAIVEAHGGRLWVEPNPGGGAVFRFVLPPPLTPTGGHEDDGST